MLAQMTISIELLLMLAQMTISIELLLMLAQMTISIELLFRQIKLGNKSPTKTVGLR